ncbi:MAG: pilus assembly protein TadG-related protein [Pseudohongiellaceae bacterium]
MNLNRRSKQKGAYLVLMTVLLAVLVGFGAVAIDLGRIFVLRSEMQNAADAAAIAAAMELDGSAGARARAEAAARTLLQHNSRFAEVNNLLGGDITLDYYCAIGSRYDPDEDEIDVFCSNGYVDGKSVATSDMESHYVRVNLDPTDNSVAYSVQLSFLPALNGILDYTVQDRAFLSATATGGRNIYMCHFPPVMLCNPFEGTTLAFDEEMNAGEQIILKQQGSDTWAPGNFTFLQPDNSPGGGAPEVSGYLADDHATGCKAPIITTSTGSMTNQTASGLNTRFDVYDNPAPYNRPDAPDNWPPAPNVIDYPHDQNWRAIDDRFGMGDWDRDSYFATYHDWQLHGRPGGWADMTRWEVYNWEISESKLPSKDPFQSTDDTSYDGIPDPTHLYTGTYPPAVSSPDRRSFHVAVVNCQAHGLSGTKTIPIVSPEGFAKLFITELVSKPPDSEVWVEYVEWADEAGENLHTDVQLYE